MLHELLGPQPVQRYKLLPHLGTICGIKKEMWLNRGFSAHAAYQIPKKIKITQSLTRLPLSERSSWKKLRGLSTVSTLNFTASSGLSSANNELVGI